MLELGDVGKLLALVPDDKQKYAKQVLQRIIRASILSGNRTALDAVSTWCQDALDEEHVEQLVVTHPSCIDGG